MKTILLLITCSIFLWFCRIHTEQGKVAKPAASFKTDTINFKTQVEPILQKNCSPCHFPGGKLYGKLPFDKAETIINHKAGVLKRIKKEEELNLVRAYTEQNKISN